MQTSVGSCLYTIPFDSDGDFVARISVAVTRVRELPRIFERVRKSLHRRCQVCITVGGRNLEQLF